MHIKADQQELSKVLSVVSKAVSIKNNLSALTNIKITATTEKVICEATDLEIAIKANLPAEILEVGSVMVPGKILTDIVKKLSSNKVELFAESCKLIINSKKSKYHLPISSEELPEFSDCNEKGFLISADTFKEAFNKVSFATIVDDPRPFMSGILIETSDALKMVGTDGNRLAIYETPINCGQNKTFIVPVKALKELASVISQDITLSANYKLLFAEFEGFKFTIRLIEAQYPKYANVIPQEFKGSFTVDRVEFIKALERTSLLCDAALFHIGESLKITTKEADRGTSFEELAITKNGDDLDIRFNIRYILEFLRVVDSDQVILSYMESQKSAKLEAKDDGKYIYIIMPLKAAA